MSTDPDPNKIAILFQQGRDLAGCDRLEEAVTVWTKILFLDRGNLQAKLALENAKSSIAERLRQLDQEVALAKEDFERGERVAARARLRLVVEADPRHQEARLLLGRLETNSRIDGLPAEIPLSAAVDDSASLVVERQAPARRRDRNGQRSSEASPATMAAFLLVALLLLALGGGYLYVSWESLLSDQWFRVRPSSDAGAQDFLVSVPTRSEFSYYNGVRLFDKGRYREALGELRRVHVDSAEAEAARRLILRIEDRLLRDNPAPAGKRAPSGGS